MVPHALHATRASSSTRPATTACPAVLAATPALLQSALPVRQAPFRTLLTQPDAPRLFQPPVARAPSHLALVALVSFATPFAKNATVPTRQTVLSVCRPHIFAVDSA